MSWHQRMDVEPFPAPISTYLRASVVAVAGICGRPISHSQTWKGWEPVSLSRSAVAWGGGNSPSLEDISPGFRAPVLVAVLQKTRSSIYNTPLGEFMTCCRLFYSKEKNDRDDSQVHLDPDRLSCLFCRAGKRLRQRLRVESS